MNSTSNSEPKSKNWLTAFTFSVLFIVFLVINIKMIAPYILSILMGGIFSILFYPLFLRIQKWGVRPTFSASILTIGILFLIITPIFLFTLASTKQAVVVGQQMIASETLTLENITNRINHWKIMQILSDGDLQIKDQLAQTVKKAVEVTTKSMIGIASEIPDKILQLFLSMLAFFFFLIDGKKLVRFTSYIIPLDHDVRDSLYSAFKNTAISVVWATVVAATIQSFMMFIGFLILGIPAAFLAGGATFIFAWIPFIGSFPVWLGGAIYLYTQGKIGSLVAIVIIGMITSIMDNYIRPLILKGRDSLHPMISMVSIFGGIGMFGIFGVFFGPVFMAALITLIQIWPTVGKRFGLRFDSKNKNK